MHGRSTIPHCQQKQHSIAVPNERRKRRYDKRSIEHDLDMIESGNTDATE